MAAVSGRPMLVMVEPILEIAWPPQSLRKSRSRVRGAETISTVWHGGWRGTGDRIDKPIRGPGSGDRGQTRLPADFRQTAPEIRWQSCQSPERKNTPSATMAAGPVR